MYEVRAFSPTKPVAAQDLNAMEAQMIQNETDAAARQEDTAALDGETEERIGGLSIDISGAYLQLLDGEDLISAAALPVALDDVVLPTALTVAETGLTLIKGQTSQLTVSVLPVATTMIKRFLSDDRAVARVKMDGLVSAVGLGNTAIRVKCGALSAAVPVQVDLLLHPVEVWRALQFGYDEDTSTLQIYMSQQRAGIVGPEGGFIVPDGCKATLSMSSYATYGFWDFRVIQSQTGDPITTVWNQIGTNRYAYGVDLIESYTPDNDSQREDYEYTNDTGAGVYICVRIFKNFQEFTETDAAAVAELLTCRIEKV